MAETKLIVAEITSQKNGWTNFKTNEGKEISVKDDKADKVVAQLKDFKAGIEVTGNLVEKDGKFYLWNSDEKKGGFGGKGFAPKDKKFDAAGIALNAAAAMFTLDKDKDVIKVLQVAESFHAFLMSKATAPATETK